MAQLRKRCRGVTLLVAIGCVVASAAAAQAPRRFLPGRSLLPDLYAGPRDPVSKGELLLVPTNPDLYGDGIEAEVALGTTFPVLRLAGTSQEDAVVVGVEAAAFARFALQLVERELVATDWVFAVPVVWHLGDDWVRLRYYHTSSHIGDEYARRFGVPGVNSSRDAIDALGFVHLRDAVGAYAGLRWAYNVHPEQSHRWVGRIGVELGHSDGAAALLPYASLDLEADQDVDWKPRFYAQAGVWLPTVSGRRALRVGMTLLTGPSPMGQFQGLTTTQIGLGVSGEL